MSRWDRLKDPTGVLEGFAHHVAPDLGAHLILGGPAIGSVSDDPEEGAVLREVRAAWEALGIADRLRVHLASIPMDVLDENAAMVNALQRRADVVVQNLAPGAATRWADDGCRTAFSRWIGSGRFGSLPKRRLKT